MEKLAIIGASYLQEPLIRTAVSMGIETHVFAWETGDSGEKAADYFYPISIVEKERILQKCREIGIDGICSAASDLAMPTVNYVAAQMNLIGNSALCTERSTNKYAMYRCFREHGDPVPPSCLISAASDIRAAGLDYPLVVKPTDRSGSRGVSLVKSEAELSEAVRNAREVGFEKRVLAAQYIHGREYSVESVSWRGRHTVLAVTYKYTTGAPHFIESAQLEPAPVSAKLKERIEAVVCHALDSLGIEYGASHTEVMIDSRGKITIIEIGGRMGGDHIGSRLVKLSSGIDFLKAVIDVSLGREPELTARGKTYAAAIRYFFAERDAEIYRLAAGDPSVIIMDKDMPSELDGVVTDSSNRHGFFLMAADTPEALYPYLPEYPAQAV